MTDVGLTHIALPMTNPQRSLAFYQKYANMEVVHRRADPETGREVVWLSDHTRPFVIVLLEVETVKHPLKPSAHLGVGCKSKAEVDRLAQLAKNEDCLILGPSEEGPPVGYWAILKDPDGHTLELAYGQQVALTVFATHSSDLKTT